MTREMQWKEIGKLEDENEGLRVIAENLLHTLVLVQRERDKTRAELAEAKPLLKEASDDWIPHVSSLSAAITDFLRRETK